jgi:hypothetical protein
MPDSIFNEEVVAAIHDTKKDSVEELKQKIDSYMEIRRTYCDEHWDVIEELATMEQFEKDAWADPRVLTGRFLTPARVSAHSEMLEANVFNQAPKFFMEGATSRQEDLAEDFQEASNNEWLRDRRLKGQTLLPLRDCGQFGFGFVLQGFTTDPDIAERARKKRQRIAIQLQSDPTLGLLGAEILSTQAMGPDSVTISDEMEYDYEMDDRVLKDRASLRHVPHDQVIMDACGTCMEDIRYIGRRIFADIEAVKMDPLLMNTGSLKASKTLSYDGMIPKSVLRNIGVGGKLRSERSAYNFITMWEVYMKQQDGTWDQRIFAEGYNKWLRHVPAQYDIGNPYSMLRWNQRGNNVFAISDIAKVLPFILAERDLHTRLYEATMRELEDTYGVNGKVTEEQLNAIIHVPNVGNFVRFEDLPPTLSLQQAIQLLPKNAKANQLMAYLALIERQYEMGLGMGANQQLQALKSSTTATEAATIEKRAASRESVKRTHFQDFIGEIQHKRLGIMCQFYNTEMWAQIVGKEAAGRMVKENFTTSDIQFGMSVSVVPGSMDPPSTEREVQLLTTMLQESMQFPALAGLYNQPAIALGRLKALGVKDGSKYLMPGVTADKIATAAMGLAAAGAGGQQGAPAATQGGEGAAVAAQMGGGEIAPEGF